AFILIELERIEDEFVEEGTEAGIDLGVEVQFSSSLQNPAQRGAVGGGAITDSGGESDFGLTDHDFQHNGDDIILDSQFERAVGDGNSTVGGKRIQDDTEDLENSHSVVIEEPAQVTNEKSSQL